MDALGHPPDFLHARLESKPNCSLVLQDLKELSEVRGVCEFSFQNKILSNIAFGTLGARRKVEQSRCSSVRHVESS